MPPRRKPQPTTQDAVIALARRARRPEADMLEAWNEIAAVREFERGQLRSVAEADALDDLRLQHEPQRTMV